MLVLSHRGGRGSGLSLGMLLGSQGGVLLVLRLVLVMLLLLLMLEPGRFRLRILVLVGEDVRCLSLKHGEAIEDRFVRWRSSFGGIAKGVSDKLDCQLKIGSQKIILSENKKRRQNHGRFRRVEGAAEERSEEVWVGEVEDLKES